jgi:hypothetical protein
MIVPKCSEYAQQEGFFEVTRSQIVRLLRAFKYDELFHWCSKTVSQRIFQGAGRIFHSEAREEYECNSEVIKDWAEHLPLILANADAVGFGIAMSRQTYREAMTTIGRFQPPDSTVVPPAAVDEHMRLLSIDPRTVRVFFSPGDSITMHRWMISMPIVIKCLPSEASPQHARMNLISSDTMQDTVIGNTIWYIPPLEEVFVYCGDPSDLPDIQLCRPISKVQRLMPERGREQINNATLSRTNLTNGGPPIPIEHKESKSKGREDEMSNDEQRMGAQSDTSSRFDQVDESKPIRAGAPQILDEPSPFNLYINHDKPRPDAIVKNDWAMQDFDDDWDGIRVERLEDRVVQLAPDRTIGQTQLPVAPAYYNEQKAHRKSAAASVWGIPLSIMQNYSIFSSGTEAKAGLAGMGNKNSGLGGATSSTKSTAWQVWEDTINGESDKLERWSANVLKSMLTRYTHEQNKQGLHQCLDRALGKFYREHGTEEEFIQRMNTAQTVETHPHLGDSMATTRLHTKEKYLSDAKTAWSEGKVPDLVYRLKRSQPTEVIRQLFVEGFLKADSAVRMLSGGLHIDPSDFESADKLDKVRKLRNEPEPKPAAQKKAKK